MRSDYLKGLASGYGFTVLNIAAQIALVPLYLRYLGKVQFGILMMLLAYINYSAVGVNWLTGGLLRAFGRYSAACNQIAFSHAFRLARHIYVGYAIIIGAVMLTFAWVNPGPLFGYPQGVSDSTLWWAVCATVAYLVLFYAWSGDRVALTALGLQHWAYNLQIASLAIYAVGAVMLLMAGAGVAGLMAVMALGALVALVWARRIWAGQSFAPSGVLGENAGHRAELLKQLFGRQGAGYLVYGAIVLTMQADVLLLGWMGGAAVAAEYVVLWKAAEVAVLMLWRIPETLIPELIRADVEGDENRLSAVFWRTWRWTIGLSAFGGVAYALFGRAVVALWLGEKAVPEASYAFWLAGIALFFLSATRPAAIYAYATCRFRALLSVAGLELAIKLSVFYWLYPTLGYLAPLVGLIAANIFGVYFLYGTLVPKRQK